MRKKIVTMVVAVAMAFSVQTGVFAETGDLGANWEYDTFGANISINIENEETAQSYKLQDYFVFYTETFCSGLNGKQGTRALEVKAYEGSASSGIGNVQFKDKEDDVWKDISLYNTSVSFSNDVDRCFRLQFVKNGIYTVRNYFIASDKTAGVSSKIRYFIVDNGKLTVTRVAPNPKNYVEETTKLKNEETTTLKKSQVQLGTVSVKSAVRKKSAKKVKITLKKTLKGADGYIVCFYKTKGNAKKNKKVFVKRIYTKNKKVFTVSNKYLKKQKKLYVRIRGYKVVNKKMIYSKKWSAIKKVKKKK